MWQNELCASGTKRRNRWALVTEECGPDCNNSVYKQSRKSVRHCFSLWWKQNDWKSNEKVSILEESRARRNRSSVLGVLPLMFGQERWNAKSLWLMRCLNFSSITVFGFLQCMSWDNSAMCFCMVVMWYVYMHTLYWIIWFWVTLNFQMSYL